MQNIETMVVSKERGAGWARPRPTGTTLFITLGWGGLLPSRATFEKSCSPPPHTHHSFDNTTSPKVPLRRILLLK